MVGLEVSCDRFRLLQPGRPLRVREGRGEAPIDRLLQLLWQVIADVSALVHLMKSSS
jgi:hypothetical protein